MIVSVSLNLIIARVKIVIKSNSGSGRMKILTETLIVSNGGDTCGLNELFPVHIGLR